jgi:hypothetical protein
MKTVKMVIILFGLFFAGSAFAQSFKSGSEPNGFRNVKWGTELSTFSGMKYYKTSTAGGSYPVDQSDSIREIHLNIYLKMGDKLRIEGTKVKRIEYGFWNEKFFEVTITTEGFRNWVSLQKAISGKYGEGKAVKFHSYRALGFEGFEETEWHIWLGKITEMELLYDGSSQIGELWMGSTVLREQAFKEAAQKQRGGKK